MDVKSKIEALLYCMPEGITTRALAKYCETASAGEVKKALCELQSEYGERDSGLRITQNGEFWKFRVRDDLNLLVASAAEPEFEKSVLETLAYIAWKKSILQSELVKARSTKAYDHVKTLLEMDLISSEKSGVSKLLKPTRNFYKYFNIDENQKLNFDELLEVEEDIGAGKIDENTAKDVEETIQPENTTQEIKEDVSEEKKVEPIKKSNEKEVLVSDWEDL